MGSVLYRCLAVCILSSSVAALPLVTPAGDSSLGLELPLAFSPLLFLIFLKIGYVGYRQRSSSRGRTGESIGVSFLTLRLGSGSVYLKLVQTAYLVGFLGSPTWEARASADVNDISRGASLPHGIPSYSSSPILRSVMLSGSPRITQGVTYYPRHSSRRPSPCRSSHCKEDVDTGHHSYPSIRLPINLRAKHDVTPTQSTLAPVHFRTRNECIMPEWPSASLMQVIQPVMSATTPIVNIRSEAQPLAESCRVQSACQTDRPQGVLKSQSARPTVRTPTTDVLTERNDVNALDAAAFSTCQAVSVALPPCAYHTASRHRSLTIIPGTWVRNNFIPTVAQQIPQASPDTRETKAREAVEELYKEIRAPLLLTTKPLNGVVKTDCGSSPYTSPEPLSTIEVMTGRRLEALPKHRDASVSPQIEPSRLRNSFVLESSSTSVSSIDGSRPAPICPSWDLDDLLVDGQLDINAVTVALGLGLSMGSIEATEESISITAERYSSGSMGRHDASCNLTLSTAGDYADGTTALASLQVHVPGAQLTAIPEVAEDISSLELSPYTAASQNSRASFVQLAEDYLTELASAGTTASVRCSRPGSQHLSQRYWQDERSWRDDGIASRQ